jgi:NADPH-dependent 2,4-dienoyl-CoA reductase/sulfur reductase-like enzyme/rhodanese-related sulfurtransferase/two-component sensor histidine kinase
MSDSGIMPKDLIGTLSHQLKSPVTTIQSLLKTIADGFTGETNPQTLQFIEKALKKAAEANALIADLLRFDATKGASKAGGNMGSDDVDVVALAESVVSSFLAEASEKNISLRVQLPAASVIIVRGDARGLEIVMRNLVENAIKYTQENGYVLVKMTASVAQKRCFFQVTDSGFGIPESERAELFTPFFRSVKHKASVGGTGLGLAITKNIVAGHGGTISVVSKEGRGSTFRIMLPFRSCSVRRTALLKKKRVLIIGGVTAGPKAAARLRRLDERLDITIIERSEFLSYSGCGLPSYISGRVVSPKALMSTADNTIRDINFFESIRNIKILNRTEAVRIDRKRNVVAVRDLATRELHDIPYDVLVLATGADSVKPPIPGIGLPGIFSLHRMEDAEAIKGECRAHNARDVLIIGGGLIGIETAESLIEAGARVTILEKKKHILSSLFDDDFSEKIENALNRKGIKVVTGISIKRIARKDNRLVFSTDGGVFYADLVILSTGVMPNSSLAGKAGIAVSKNGAIRVNRHLQTSDKNIYAIGDCAESVNFLTKKHEYWPLGSISTKMGRIAADHICGRNSEFKGFIGTTMFQNFDLAIARTGLTVASAQAHGFSPASVVITGLDKAHYSRNAEYVTLKIIADVKTGRLIGGQAYGRGDVVRHIQIVATAISQSLSLSNVFDLDLGYAPVFNNPIDIVQTACCVLSSKMEGFVKTMTPDRLRREGHSLNIIDVSPFVDHTHGAIPGSINVPLENLRREGIPFDAKTRCVLYSKTSSRAYEAFRYLVAKGYANLSILEGGYLFWTV